MKTFTIVYLKTIRCDKIVHAKNEKEARKTFQKFLPDVRVIDVQQWDEIATKMRNYGGGWL